MEVAEAQPLAVLWLGERRERYGKEEWNEGEEELGGRGERMDRIGKGNGAEGGRLRWAIGMNEQEATC